MIKPMKQLTQSVILKRKRKDFCGGTRRIRGDHPCRIEWKLLLAFPILISLDLFLKGDQTGLELVIYRKMTLSF